MRFLPTISLTRSTGVLQDVAMALEAAQEGLLDPTCKPLTMRAELDATKHETARQQACNRALYAEIRKLKDSQARLEDAASRRSTIQRVPPRLDLKDRTACKSASPSAIVAALTFNRLVTFSVWKIQEFLRLLGFLPQDVLTRVVQYSASLRYAIALCTDTRISPGTGCQQLSTGYNAPS
jgi:hypothetical protein